MKYTELIEKIKHGSDDFPLQYYYQYDGVWQYVMPLHWHREFEILHIVSGEFKLYLSNVEYILKPGDIAFIGCGILHRGEPIDCVYQCTVFDLNMLRRRSNDRLSPQLLSVISGDTQVECFLNDKESELYKTVIRLFDNLREHKEFFEFAVFGELFNMFSLLFKSGRAKKAEKSKRTAHKADTMATIVSWIEEHYAEHISLKQLAAICGMNEKYLCHLIKEYTDSTPIEYINKLRIESACHEMTVNHKTVTEAAYESGFNDLSYFSRTFKRLKGVTPKQYSMQHNG